MEPRWTIHGLAHAVQEALAASGYEGQGSGRVRAIPDLRTIRYYTTLGLLAPPAEMRGRKALYGRRHVLQLAAIKRLQARGLSLVQVQEALVGARDDALARLAAVPEDLWERLSAMPAAPCRPLTSAMPAPPGPRSEASLGAQTNLDQAFWAQTPEVAPSAPGAGGVQPTRPRPSPAVHLRVAPGAELVLEGASVDNLDARALAELGTSLGQVAEVLRRFGLVPGDGNDSFGTAAVNPVHETHPEEKGAEHGPSSHDS